MRFRERHPTYQREWRILQSLREIRDAIGPALLAVDRPLSKLVSRLDDVLEQRARDGAPARADRRDRFTEIAVVARAISRLLTELTSLFGQIEGIAAGPPLRDTRRD